jgi:hypothetical protein
MNMQVFFVVDIIGGKKFALYSGKYGKPIQANRFTPDLQNKFCLARLYIPRAVKMSTLLFWIMMPHQLILEKHWYHLPTSTHSVTTKNNINKFFLL